ncbi:hypothetical protein [Microbacterium sp. PAMC22086]|uniref:hypothetical protein n=1 Tax=Microbacterium sp. PAMC22086 TaxID=2861281 RepID=UPI001C62CDC3|nr:hypothetical protein [Microbacterium sp. PAMC22086]QYG11381.1 hypothetical protein KY497_14120 [Microbacterium sp. PAMC22086]
MGTSDDERAFLDEVSLASDKEVCFLPTATADAVALLGAIRDSGSWVGSDRPDFHSEAHELAIEVMRVDDHPRVGKVTNPTLARERKIEREVREAVPSIGHDVRVVVTADTGLSSEEDHNFDAYRQAFSRIVVGHSQKVEAYREHHPEYALAMLIRDESSAYAQAERPAGAPAEGETIVGQPHYWFLDAYFTRIIATSKADFVIWSTPYKHAWHVDAFGRRVKMHLPTLAIYDVAAMSGWDDPFIYETNRMISVER